MLALTICLSRLRIHFENEETKYRSDTLETDGTVDLSEIMARVTFEWANAKVIPRFSQLVRPRANGHGESG